MATVREVQDIKQQFARFKFEGPCAEHRDSKTQQAERQDLDVVTEGVSNITLDGSDESSKQVICAAQPLEEKPLQPDFVMLAGIFSNKFDSENDARFGCCMKVEVELLHSSPDTCTFIIYFGAEDESPKAFPTHLQARVEKPRPGNPLFSTAAVQRLAHRQLPVYVPKVWGFGETLNGDGVGLHYLLTQHYEDVVTADQIWHKFNGPVQRALVEDVARLMEPLSCGGLPFSSSQDTAFLTHNNVIPKGLEDAWVAGGTESGWHTDFKSFLMTALAPGQAKHELETRQDGSLVVTDTFYKDRTLLPQQVVFTPDNLEVLWNTCGLRHNNLEPCNILLRERPTDFGPGYEFVAIINWDAAGFFPLVYETAMMDIGLGLRSRNADWYEELREYADVMYQERWGGRNLALESHEKLAEALWLVETSRKRSQGFHVGNRFQKKWLQREKFVKFGTPLDGFKRQKGWRHKSYTEADDQKLEAEAMAELGYL
ncbi:hypothetical protein Cob_v003310 [Colletotrichum orbiculare MAFF 240422]|uniref:Aminoglycoside phosphotransferase domain-containing protein n=1 Tax=Colletotrichum orbiculare (strain 104-T / ATCC 96160 / CBS 514.97 / LARS 414 / MAFF 240422) TaxID=1213857 RepID=N4VIW2_COLOR|nr:hypothetical protein Cob_v003310 [Colletotrichum orbiculare MAFF 240422]